MLLAFEMDVYVTEMNVNHVTNTVTVTYPIAYL